MTKGEKFELVFKRVYIYGRFLLSYNSRSSDDFVGSSCKLKTLWWPDTFAVSSACLFLINVIARMPNYISHHISSCISNSSYPMLNSCMNYKIWGEISMILPFKCALLQNQILTMHIFRGSSSISCNQIPQL